MLVVTSLVYRVSAGHEHDGFRRRKQIVTTDWTVALRVSFDASMRALKRHRHANITGLDVSMRK